MRNFNLLVSFLMIAGLVVAAPAFGAEMNNQGSSTMKQSNQNPNEMSNHEMSSRPFTHSISLSYLMNKSVRDEQGRTIGEVSDIVVGPDGHADFVILSRSGALRTSGKYIPVPWKTFTSHWTNMAEVDRSRPVVLSLAESRLDSAPGFSNKRDLTSSATRQKVCQYFKGDCAQSEFNPRSAL